MPAFLTWAEDRLPFPGTVPSGINDNGIADNRAALAAADTALGTGEVHFLTPGTYAIASDITLTHAVVFASGAMIKPASGVTVTLEPGYFASDWQHVFDLSAGGFVKGTRTAQGYITPQHFGALGDGAQDDHPAFDAACSYANLLPDKGFFSYSVEVRIPQLKVPHTYYRFASTLYVTRTIYLRGMGSVARYNASVDIRPDPGLLAAIVFLSGSASSDAERLTDSTAYEPANPVHSDPWKVYETNTTTGFVNIYVCKQEHTSAADNRPGQGVNWADYWTEFKGETSQSNYVVGTPSLHAPAWVTSTLYKTSPGRGKQGSAINSKVEGIGVRMGTLAKGQVRFGIVHNTPVHFERCTAFYFEQAGFCARGQTDIGFAPLENLLLPVGSSNSPDDFERLWTGSTGVNGSVNGSSYSNCYASGQTDGHGFICEGNNAGIVRYDNCDAAGNFGAGFCDNSAVGSHYMCGHTAQNVRRVWDAATSQMYMSIKGHTSAKMTKPGIGIVVSHGGSNYKLKKKPASTQLTATYAPGTGGGGDFWVVTGETADEAWVEGKQYLWWQHYWAKIGSTEPNKDSDWADATVYPPCGAVNISHSTLGTANIVNHYSEGGVELGIVPRGATTIIGGVAAGGSQQRVLYHPEFGDPLVIKRGGAFMNSFGLKGFNDPFGTPTEYGFWVGGTSSSTNSYEMGMLFQFGDERDDATGKIGSVQVNWSIFAKAYQWVKKSVGKPFQIITGSGFSKSGYTQDGIIGFPAGMLIGDDTVNFNNLVMLRCVNSSDLAGALTALNGQTAVHGQRWLFNQPTTGGKEGVICTTAGTIGTGAVLKAFGAIDA